MRLKLSVIIPVYNEINTIEKIIDKVINIKKKLQIELIVVDDGSTDGTTSRLKQMKDKIDKLIIKNKNEGKGSAIKLAQNKIKGNLVIIQDADLEYNPGNYIKMVELMLKKKIQVLYGSRVLNKSLNQNNKNFTHLIRIFGNYFLTKISNLINNQNLTDAHTCYKLFRSDIFKKIKLKEKGFAFCPEVNTKLSNMNISIQEIQIDYIGRSYNEGKKITILDAIYALFALLKYKIIR